jgi:hypothetical protein
MLDSTDITALQGLPSDIPRTLVAISEDPRAAELVALFNSKDARGKECLIRLARAMPCGKECG